MKIICGNWRRIEFIQGYINKNKNKEIMIVDISLEINYINLWKM